MLSRPVDASGDVMPVCDAEDLLSGPEATAAGLRDYLSLFPGDWWESPEKGNEIFDLISLSRRTEKDAAALGSYLTSYVLSFPAVQSVSGVQASVIGSVFSYACTAHTENQESFGVTWSTQ